VNDRPLDLPSANTIGEGFRSRFEVIPALTEALKDQTYRMRHSVYCEDLGFEAVRPDGREIDEYDRYATGLLIRNIPSAEFIGCARLIRPRPGAKDPLPFEHTCAHTLNRELIEAYPAARHQIAEVSRLAIVSKFRRRKGESSSPAPLAEGDFAGGPRPRFPYVLLGLYLGIVAQAEVQDVTKLFLLTEPRLAGHLSKVGFRLRQVSGPHEHRGTRILSMIIVSELIDGLSAHLRPVYEVVREQVFDSHRATSAI
jgi:N-acyl amino acid synthase of PEP-CTERM/exosortase system